MIPAPSSLRRSLSFVVALGVLTLPGEVTWGQQSPEGFGNERIDRTPNDGGGDRPRLNLPTGGGKSVPPAAVAKLRFVLKSVRIVGAKSVPASVLRPIYAQILNKRITGAHIYLVANGIAEIYRRRGFALYTVFVPRQAFTDGQIVIRVVEGYVSRVIIAGETKGADLRLIRAYAKKIADERPLRRATLERYLLLMGEIPGYTVGSSLRPVARPAGAVDLVLAVKRERFQLLGGLDNYQSKDFGPLQFQVGAAAQSLFRQGAETRGVYAFSSRWNALHFGTLSHSQIIGTEGLRLEASASYVNTKPGDDKVAGEALFLAFRATYPLFRRQRFAATLIGGFDFLNSENAFLNRTFSEDRIRALRGGIRYAFLDRLLGKYEGRTIGSLVLSQGLDVLDARSDSTPKGRTNFFKVNMSLARIQTLPFNFSATVGVSGQVAGTNLLASERFTYGGERFGRGFQPAEMAGDHGIVVFAELHYIRRDVNLLGIVKTIDVYAFWDWGRVWSIDTAFQPARETAQSAGVGLQLKLFKYVTARFEAAKPLLRTPVAIDSDPNDWQFRFKIRIEYPG